MRLQDFHKTGKNRDSTHEDSTHGGHTQNLCTPGPRAKDVTPQETEPDFPTSVGGSLAGVRGGSSTH